MSIISIDIDALISQHQPFFIFQFSDGDFTMINSYNITIRKARREDEAELAELAYTAYYDRFFNDEVTNKYGASLKVYPELIPDEEKDTGQSRSTFRDYWKQAMTKLGADNGRFLCFVAGASLPEGKKIVGFRKGYAAPLEDKEYERYEKENKIRLLMRRKNAYLGINAYNDLRPIPLPAKNKIAGSSSLYIAPEYKRAGIGARLIQRYAQELIKMGFEGMMTSCYIKNDSQKFLRAQGGDYFIRCDIPVVYKKADGSSAVRNIDGLMCLWDAAGLRKLAFRKENAATAQKIFDSGRGRN